MIKLVVKSVVAQIEQPVKPKPDVAPIFCPEIQNCIFLSDFEGGRRFQFKNSILQPDVKQPSDDSPLKLQIPAGLWSISGVILLRSKKHRAFNFEFEGKQITCALGYRSPKYTKPILGFKPLTTGPSVTLTGGSTMTITQAEPRRKRKRPAGPSAMAEETDDHGVICLILKPATPVSSFTKWLDAAKNFLAVRSRVLRLGRRLRKRLLPTGRRRNRRRR